VNDRKTLILAYLTSETSNCVTQEETKFFQDTFSYMNFIRSLKEKPRCVMCVISHVLISVELLRELDSLEHVHSIIDYNPSSTVAYSGYSKINSMPTTLDQLQFQLSHNLAIYYRQEGDRAIERGESESAEKHYLKSQTYLGNLFSSVPIEEEE
jgi:hypothetical protein